ncbi:MAG TPA: heme o synthase [Candidatus Paceibacterota bacterium]|nr:heme o synthase [Candidatus Paceibacterota bacterium]
MLATYYQLAKPGIIYGNAVTAAAGFFVAAAGAPDFPLLAATLIGLSLVVASGCVFNNYIDRDIDGRMERTKGRALVRGLVPLRASLSYGAVLGILGLAALVTLVNLLAALVALGGFAVYVFAYTILAKRRSVYATHVGSIAGAVPPVVGYVAALGRLDLGALVLFLILCFWQMPHFFAIALNRRDDYAAAGVPVLPVVRGARSAKLQSAWYVAAFLVATILLAALGYAGVAYLVVAVVLGIAWLGLALVGLYADDDRRWARRMFVASLIVLTVLCVMMSVDARPGRRTPLAPTAPSERSGLFA